MNESIPDSIYTAIDEIAKNTEPLLVYSIDISHLTSWSFIIAILSLLVSLFAASFSYLGYYYQRISAKHLGNLVPGQMSYYEMAISLINNILAIEAIYFGKLSYTTYPTKLILSISKLPEDLIQLDKYEKNQTCFDEAFKLKMSWQNYNTFLDTLIEQSSSKEQNKTKLLAQFLIHLSKNEIARLQRFEEVLLTQKFLSEKSASKERLGFYIMNQFCETIHCIRILKITDLETTRNNYNETTRFKYTFSPYLPEALPLDKYLREHHKKRLSDLGKDFEAIMDYDPRQIIEEIMNGKLDSLGDMIGLSKKNRMSDLDLNRFNDCYYSYIEPLLIGKKRREFLSLLKS